MTNVSPNIDHNTFRKVGTSPRSNGLMPNSMIIHSTNGATGSSFTGEAKYLMDNDRGVSAHYLVGKNGQIAEIVPPEHLAIHSGSTKAGYSNTQSIGIECHHAKGENWTAAQFSALTELVRFLMERFHIPKANIETHRAVALPLGRKEDPSDWSNEQFYKWRDSLTTLTYRVLSDQTKIYEGPGLNYPVALNGGAIMNTGATFKSDGVTKGQVINGSNSWIHRADGIGFVHSSLVSGS
jgi:N-acetyl-anhydromuramyl-L-alanine amidase AmpD